MCCLAEGKKWACMKNEVGLRKQKKYHLEWQAYLFCELHTSQYVNLGTI